MSRVKISVSFEVIDDEVLDSSSEDQAQVHEIVVKALESFEGDASESESAIIEKLLWDWNCEEKK